MNDEVYIVTFKGEPVCPKGKKMPKTYTSPHNAHIAIMNMGGYVEGYEITVYKPVGVVTQIGDRKLPENETKLTKWRIK